MLLDPANKQHYDLMSAIRGPDRTEVAVGINGYWLKMAFTAPLRTLVGVPTKQAHASTGWGWWDDFQASQWKSEKIEELRREAKSAGDHFLAHLGLAWRAANDIGICQYGYAMAACIESLRPPPKGLFSDDAELFANVLRARKEEKEVPDAF